MRGVYGIAPMKRRGLEKIPEALVRYGAMAMGDAQGNMRSMRFYQPCAQICRRRRMQMHGVVCANTQNASQCQANVPDGGNPSRPSIRMARCVVCRQLDGRDTSRSGNSAHVENYAIQANPANKSFLLYILFNGISTINHVP